MKHVRLDEFFRRLTAMRPARTHAEAYEQLCGTLNAVEDELSGEPYDPDAWAGQDRMYPPQPDSARKVRDYPGVTRYRNKGHNTFIGANGAIEIQTVDRTVVFKKTGADGRGVWDP